MGRDAVWFGIRYGYVTDRGASETSVLFPRLHRFNLECNGLRGNYIDLAVWFTVFVSQVT